MEPQFSNRKRTPQCSAVTFHPMTSTLLLVPVTRKPQSMKSFTSELVIIELSLFLFSLILAVYICVLCDRRPCTNLVNFFVNNIQHPLLLLIFFYSSCKTLIPSSLNATYLQHLQRASTTIYLSNDDYLVWTSQRCEFVQENQQPKRSISQRHTMMAGSLRRGGLADADQEVEEKPLFGPFHLRRSSFVSSDFYRKKQRTNLCLREVHDHYYFPYPHSIPMPTMPRKKLVVTADLPGSLGPLPLIIIAVKR